MLRRVLHLILLGIVTLSAIGMSILWIAQFQRPVYLSKGPKFLDTEWSIENDGTYSGWMGTMPTGTDSQTLAVEVAEHNAPLMLPKTTMLLGAAYGKIHYGKLKI